MLFHVFASALALSATAYSAPTPQSTPLATVQVNTQAVSAQAAVNAAAIKPALDGLKDKATALKKPIDSLDGSSSTQFVTGGGPFPAVISGIQDIAANAQGLAVLLQSAPQIPSGTDATSVIDSYQAFAKAQQAALDSLNSKLNANPPSPTVAAPLSAVLQNLQVGVTNLFNQLSARLATPDVPTPVPEQNTNAIQNLLSTLTTTLNSLLAGLNVQNIINGLTGTLAQLTGNLSLLSNAPTVGNGGFTSGGLPALPFYVPVNYLLGGGLNLGNLPIFSQIAGLTGGVLSSTSTASAATATASSTANNVLNGVKGLVNSIVAKRMGLN